eukprot:3317016-Prorocentrum_lima.AAC.1
MQLYSAGGDTCQTRPRVAVLGDRALSASTGSASLQRRGKEGGGGGGGGEIAQGSWLSGESGLQRRWRWGCAH